MLVIAILLAVVLVIGVVLFAWALCAAAALGDLILDEQRREIREIEDELRRVQLRSDEHWRDR